MTRCKVQAGATLAQYHCNAETLIFKQLSILT